MTELDDRERRIIAAYFGLDGHRPMTLEEIGSVLGVTRERVRQLRDRALETLRRHLDAERLEFSPN